MSVTGTEVAGAAQDLGRVYCVSQLPTSLQQLSGWERQSCAWASVPAALPTPQPLPLLRSSLSSVPLVKIGFDAPPLSSATVPYPSCKFPKWVFTHPYA